MESVATTDQSVAEISVSLRTRKRNGAFKYKLKKIDKIGNRHGENDVEIRCSKFDVPTSGNVSVNDRGSQNTFTTTNLNQVHQRIKNKKKICTNARKRNYKRGKVKFNSENNHKITSYFTSAQTNTRTGDVDGIGGRTEVGMGVENTDLAQITTPGDYSESGGGRTQ